MAMPLERGKLKEALPRAMSDSLPLGVAIALRLESSDEITQIKKYPKRKRNPKD